MKKILLSLFVLFYFSSVSSQQKTQLFSVEIKKHIKKFNSSSDIAYKQGDYEKGDFLFDSLVENYLVGTRIDDYSLKCLNKKKFKLSKINKPILIVTYSSWCVMNKAEIPALNKIAKKHEKDFQLIVLFWDRKKDIKKKSALFNSNIRVCYADESYNSDEDLVSTLKHYLGFPTSYFLNENLEIVDIQRGNPQVAFKTSFPKALEQNLNFFQKRIATYLIKKESSEKQFANEGN